MTDSTRPCGGFRLRLAHRSAQADERDLALAVPGLRGVKAAGRIERRSHWRHSLAQPRCTLSLSLPRRPRSREQAHVRAGARRTARSSRAGPSGDDPGEPGEHLAWPRAIGGRR